MVIAVDFDGTVVCHEFPEIGKDVPEAEQSLKKLSELGHQLILWTMRSGPSLLEAIEWYRQRNIPLYGINSNPSQKNWTTSPKAHADVYIDDAAFGCPRIVFENFEVVCWKEIMKSFGS